MKRRWAFTVAAVLAVAWAGEADAQIWKKIKDTAKQKVAERTAKTAEKIVTRSGEVVDSAVEKTGRGVDTVVAQAGTAADTVINKTERGIGDAVEGAGRALTGSDPEAAALTSQLAAGRAVIAGIRFAKGSHKLERSSDAALRRLAAAIAANEGAYVIEAYVAPSGDALGDQTLSDRRAVVVKARLGSAGIAEPRLFAMGFGSSRGTASSDGTMLPSTDRIEVMRMR